MNEQVEREAFEAAFPIPECMVMWDGAAYIPEKRFIDSYRADRYCGQWLAWKARAAIQALAPAPAVPDDSAVVPRDFVRALGTLVHNYSLRAEPAGHYSGVERDAFAAAYRECGRALAGVWAMLSAAPQPAQQAAHPDDEAVDHFAAAMKQKLALARTKGRGGWQTCGKDDLSRMLREHVEKGDPRDVANFCMFLWSLGHGIAQQGPAGEAVYQYQLHDKAWIDQTEDSYRYNLSLGSATVRVLYTRPQQPLTEEQVDAAIGFSNPHSRYSFAHAIERAHKIGVK